MTNQEKQQLSRDVADKLGIAEKIAIGTEPYYDDECNYRGDVPKFLWIHDDSARCFDLCAEHEIDINNYGNWAMAVSDTGEYREYAKDHDNDKAMTARIVGLEALRDKDM